MSYGYKKTFNATASYSHTKNVIAATLITDTIVKTILIKDENLASMRVFDLMKARVSSVIPTQDYKLIQKQETRIFRLTFSYNIGSSQIKAVREHSSASETEQKRVRSGN